MTPPPDPTADRSPAPERTSSPPVARRLAPTLRGRLGLTLLHLTAGAAWLTGDDTARLAAAMVAAPVLVDLLAKLGAAPRLVAWTAGRRTQARAPFFETVVIANHGARAVRGLEIREPRTFALRAGGAEVPFLARGGELGVRLAARSPQRGIRTARQFVASTAWPLGFFRWELRLDAPARLVTEPARSGVDPALLRATLDAPPDPAPGRRDDAAEFHSLREYRYGEDARLVHARRSAALGHLVRMQYRGTTEPDGAVVVDLRRPAESVAAAASVGAAVLETQLGRAAAVCDRFLAAGTRFRAVVIDAGIRTWQIDGTGAAHGFLDALAVARAVPNRPLTPDELAQLPNAGRCVWLAAGGHVETGFTARRHVTCLAEAAS